MTNEQKLLDAAKWIADSAVTWADLSNALFDPQFGLVAHAFPTRKERELFVRTEEYAAIRKLIEAARDRTGLAAGANPTAMRMADRRCQSKPEPN